MSLPMDRLHRKAAFSNLNIFQRDPPPTDAPSTRLQISRKRVPGRLAERRIAPNAVQRPAYRAIGLALLMSLSALFFARPPAAAEESPRKFTLASGVRLILKPETSAELLAVSVCIRTAPDRSATEAAAGEVVARALFQSSTNRSGDAIARSLAQIGGRLETLRTPDHVSITCLVLPTQIREAAYLLCETLKNADFAPTSLDYACRSLERSQRSAAGFARAVQLLRVTMQGTPDIDLSHCRRVTQGQAAAYFHSRYTADHTVIAVAGRFDLKTAQTAFDNDLFDFDRRTDRPLPKESLFAHATPGPTQIVSQPVTTGYALVATPGAPVASPDYPAFVVMQSILGGGHASRLFRRLRDAQGIGYNVGAVCQAYDSDPLISYVQWDVQSSQKSGAQPSPTETIRLLNAQLDDFLKDPPTEAEVERARNVAVGQEALRRERARNRAFLLAWYEAMGAGFEFDTALPGLLQQVTRDQVLRAAKVYLSPRASALVLPAP